MLVRLLPIFCKVPTFPNLFECPLNYIYTGTQENLNVYDYKELDYIYTYIYVLYVSVCTYICQLL